jgi:hypothetical protein
MQLRQSSMGIDWGIGRMKQFFKILMEAESIEISSSKDTDTYYHKEKINTPT